MDEEMQQLWSNFTLGEEESLGVHLLDQGDGELGEKGKLCIFGKVLSDKLYNKVAFKSMMKKVWNNIKVEFIEVGDNLFLIQFSNMLDKNRVLEVPATKGPMQFGAWLRAPVGRGSKIIFGQNARVEKPPGGEKSSGVSPERGPKSLGKPHKNRKAVNEECIMGRKGSIIGDEGITITKSLYGRQNMEREISVELREVSVNIPNYLPKERVIMAVQMRGICLWTRVIDRKEIGPLKRAQV
ncbi:unnamed protein product [Ilex paraguariensis]|uniref:DUF4283 domain-containing protein n=1 Tax=Ilex paraguariensis TaxID=185542 RepID=A0ABC8SIZ8_9AQUA